MSRYGSGAKVLKAGEHEDLMALRLRSGEFDLVLVLVVVNKISLMTCGKSLRDTTGLDSGDRSWICNAALITHQN